MAHGRIVMMPGYPYHLSMKRQGARQIGLGLDDRRLRGFISFAHDDYKMYQEFRTRLRSVERAFDFIFWSDARIETGYHWGKEISNHIDTANVFVLLISNAFIASDYIWTKELPAIE